MDPADVQDAIDDAIQAANAGQQAAIDAAVDAAVAAAILAANAGQQAAIDAAVDAAVAAAILAANAGQQAAINAAVTLAQAGNQAAIDAAVAAAVAAAQVPAAPAAPPAPVQYARNPAAVNGGQFAYDWSTTRGIKMYGDMTAPIVPQFSGKQENLRSFLSLFLISSNSFGWTDIILTIPDPVPRVPPRPGRNLVTQYGMIPYDDVREHVAQYVGTQTRAAQAAEIMAILLAKSLAEIPFRRLLTKEDQFTIDGRHNGPLMLKVLLSQVTLETRSTIANLMKQLYALPKLMMEMNSDIIGFNEKVMDIINHLLCLGQSPNDMFEPLFAAYLSASDEVFVDYINTKRSNWLDNTMREELTYESLMFTAEEKYKSLVHDKAWNKPSKAQEEITALTLQLVALKAESHKPRDKKQTEETKETNEKSARNDKKWAWKTVAPSAGQPTEKKFEGKEYVFCPHHPKTKWVLKAGHVNGCDLDPAASKKSGGRPAAKSISYDTLRALLGAIVEDDDGEADDGES